MPKKSPTSQKIGATLAQLQTFVDNIFESGFKKLKKIGKNKPPAKKPENFKDQATDLAQKSASFLGEIGSSYYENYQKLKAKREKRKSK